MKVVEFFCFCCSVLGGVVVETRAHQWSRSPKRRNRSARVCNLLHVYFVGTGGGRNERMMERSKANQRMRECVTKVCSVTSPGDHVAACTINADWELPV